jgi:hypothetical protein
MRISTRLGVLCALSSLAVLTASIRAQDLSMQPTGYVSGIGSVTGGPAPTSTAQEVDAISLEGPAPNQGGDRSAFQAPAAVAQTTTDDYVTSSTTGPGAYHHTLRFHFTSEHNGHIVNVTCNGQAAEPINTTLEKNNVFVTFSCDDEEPTAKWKWDTEPVVTANN